MPTSNQADALIELIDQVRSLFHQLKAVARQVHGGTELTAGRRGVMLDLRHRGPQTVPALARSRPVSRQHIQTLVNALLADGLVALEPNPAHRRSKLVALTDAGAAAITDMVARERQILEVMPLGVATSDLRAAARVLRKTREAFQTGRQLDGP